MKKVSFFIIALITAFSLSSCEDKVIEDLDAAQSKWTAFKATKYAFDYTYSCFCLREQLPAHIVVENNVITDVLDIDTGQPKLYSSGTAVVDSLPWGFYTVPQLFTVIEDAKNSDVLEVTYDNASGVPLSIQIDGSTNIADDEIFYTISNFEKL